MELSRLAIAILSVTFIGFNIIYPLSYKRNKLYMPEAIAISYGMGFGFVSLEMLILYFLKLQFTLTNILLPWSVLLAFNTLLFFRNRGRPVYINEAARPEAGHKLLKIFLSFAIAFEIVYAFFRALVKPLEAYDAIAIYGIKAKIFYLARSIPHDFFQSLALRFPHADYPLNLPLSETFLYIFMGNFNDQLVKVIFPLYFVAILVLIYFGIRRFASRTYSLLFTFILASVPQFNAYATNGYLDLPLAYYCFAGALFLFLWFKDTKNLHFLSISAGFVALAGWTKNEGLMYCGINVLLILIFFIFNSHEMPLKKKIIYLAGYAGIILIISIPWTLVKIDAHLVNDEIGMSNMTIPYLSQQYHKLGPIIYEFQKQAFGPKKWNILWVILIFMLVLRYKDILKTNIRYISIAVFLVVSGYVLSYLVSGAEIHYAVRTTWSRFLIHFLPITIYWLANIFKEGIDL